MVSSSDQPSSVETYNDDESRVAAAPGKQKLVTQPNAGSPAVASPDLETPSVPSEGQANESRRALLSFGGIVSVMMRSPQFKGVTLADLEQLVVPAISTGQYVIAEATSKQHGFVTPIGVAIWATVSDKLDQEFASNPDSPIALAADQWKSGTNPWLIAVAGDSRVINPMLQRLHETAFQGRGLKMRVRDKDGSHRIASLSTSSADDPAAQGADPA